MRLQTITKQFLRAAPLSLFGVAAAHTALYQVVYPEVTHRHDELATTGHHYFSLFTVVGLVLALGAIWHIIRTSQRHTHRHHQAQPFSFWRTQTSLFLAQSAVFIFIELSERLFSLGLAETFSFFGSSLFSLGIALQFVVACLASLTVRGSQMLGSLLHAIIAAAPHTQKLLPSTKQIYYSQTYIQSRFVRGPPSCAATHLK